MRKRCLLPILAAAVFLCSCQKQEKEQVMSNCINLLLVENIEFTNIRTESIMLKEALRKALFSKMPTENEIKNYLNMTLEEITWLTGQEIDDIKNGTMMTFSFIAYYSVLFPDEDCPYFFLFSHASDQRPAYFSFKYEYYQDYLSRIGLDKDMDFSDIMEKWGETEIKVTSRGWEINNQYHYLISYERNGLVYEFISWYEDGRDFEFYIETTRPYWD